MEFKCNKCGSNNYMIEKHGNNTGLCCSDCGKWQKWLTKDEIRVYSKLNRTEQSKENTDDSKQIIDQLKEFIDYLDKVIDNAMVQEPISPAIQIRKGAYCTALERCKHSILNIIEGKDWRSTE